MDRIYIKDIKSHIGKEITIFGFVQTIRDQGSIKFLLIRDVSGLIQVVVLKSETEVFLACETLTTESVVSISGLVKEEKQAPIGVEIQAKSITVLSLAAPELPIPIIEKKGADDVDITKRLDWRFIDLRKPEGILLFKVWTELERSFRDYFYKNNFIQLYTPSFMSTASESGANVFEVKYFDRKAYLAQSPQFYKQMAMSCGFEKVFVMGPVFRAEPSYTTRHVTEFTGWDFEVSYIKSHNDIMDIEEQLIASGLAHLKESLGLNIEVPKLPFPKMSIKEVKSELKTAGISVVEEDDLSPEEERKICEIVKEKTGSDFVFVTEYPVSVRPFYHMRCEENENLTKSFDLLYKGVEITTGAQREHRIDVLENQAKEKGVPLESISDYLNFFRFGCPSHGGIGMGPARLIMKLLDLSSIKEATFLPRDVKRLRP